jgi:small subunit ribosomal protein S9
MADEPENENTEQPEAEEPQAEETPAEETQGSEEEAPAADESPASEPQASADEPAEADAAPEAAADEQPSAEEQPAAEKSSEPVAPGADLDPIALEQPERELSAEERARLEFEAEERALREAAMDDDEVVATSRTPAEISDGRYTATGKRKSAIARVIVSSGSGEFQVNGRTLDDYFPREYHRTIARQPLAAAGYESNVDVRVRVHGGGVGGQAAAVRHGIARALTEVDPELRGDLKRRGFLTRDPRVKERKKAGLKKARKRPQFSKR